ncbi:isochorismatase family protein [Saccharomonospora saliphila]|uniref:isochorismatase family protein n=1 Tax=Saccharomonospora saliphila TaxID=369829 RepID=UPI000365F04A|nr:isochorismatase family protein [Saccharomonospora saliphila]
MGIGDISPYTPPRLPDGERGPRHWRPEPERLALLIHDMQRYFLRPFSTTESPYREMLDNLVAVRARCAEWGVPVFYTAQPGSMTDEQRGLLKDFWGPGMAARAEDREIVAELAPGDGDVVLTKWRYSAFCHTDLLSRLAAAGRDQILLGGVYAHVGCLATAIDAFSYDIQPHLVSDAVADFGEPEHRFALEYAARRCARVLDTSELLAELGSASPAGAAL